MRLTASRASITSSGGAVLDAIQQEDPTLDLNFEETKTLTDDVSGNNLVTFTRASSGTYVGSDGLIKTAVTDAPRFDHDPATGESLGLLIEESRTNQFTHSDFGNSTWVANSITKKSTNNPAPDGSNTAVLIGDAVGGPTGSYLIESLNLVGGGIQAFTFYAKGTTTGQSAFIDYFDGGANRARASISLDDGAVTYTSLIGDAVITSTDAGNGWWRCQLTLTPVGTIIFEWRVGNYGSGDIYVWGAQVEAGSFPTSYIPTSGSTVTRAADVASITGTNFSSWFNTDESTVYFEGNVIAGASGQYALWGIQGGFSNINGILMTRRSQQGSRFNHYDSGSAPDIDLNGPLWIDNSYRKLSAAIGQSSAGFADSGSLVGTDNSYQLPSASDGLDSLYLGAAYSGGLSPYNVHIKRLAYFPTRKTDQQLINMTS